MNAMVLMACSGTKRTVAAPAIDLYQGVMYETFRAHVKPHARPSVIILSALHGFIDPQKTLSPYEQKMTAERADEMIANLPRFLNTSRWPDQVDNVFLAGGEHYRRVMRVAVACFSPWMKITECHGGIGMQRSQLGHYLDNLDRQHGMVIGHHENGTHLFDTYGEFELGDHVVTKYRSAPWAKPQQANISELFDGPSGPTALIEFPGKKAGQMLARWISLDDLAHYRHNNLPVLASEVQA